MYTFDEKNVRKIWKVMYIYRKIKNDKSLYSSNSDKGVCLIKFV